MPLFIGLSIRLPIRRKPLSLRAIAIPHQTADSPVGLLILLHGWGANCQDLLGMTPYLQRPDFQMVFPDAPMPHPLVPGGRMWYSLSETFTTTGTQFGLGEAFESELAESRRLLIEWIEALAQESNIPLSRTVLAGFSQGGAMTLDLACRLPFAALMVMSGYLHKPLPERPDDLEFPLPPILMGHGRYDPAVPLKLAQEARNHLLRLNAPLQYYEFDMGHEISPELLNLMQTFMGEVSTRLRQSA